MRALILALSFLTFISSALADENYPFFVERGNPSQLSYISIKNRISTNKDARVEGNVRTVSLHSNGHQQERVEAFVAMCQGDLLTINGHTIDPSKPPQPGEDLRYALWRTACAGLIRNHFRPLTLACVTQIPRAVRELVALKESNPDRRAAADNNIRYLVHNYCFEIDEPLRADAQEDIGGGCIMYTGIHRNVRVYWPACKVTAKSNTSENKKSCFNFGGQRICE